MVPVAVVAYSSNPIIHAGLSTILRANRNIRVLRNQHIVNADVVVIAADTVTNETIATLREVASRSSARIVLLSNEIAVNDVSTLAKFGVVTIISRSSATTEPRLIEIVLAAAKESRLPASKILARLQTQLKPKRPGTLWPIELDTTGLDYREKILLKLMSEGHSTEEIANKMDYSEGSVNLIIRRILSCLGVHSRVEAVGHAIRTGQLDLD